MLQKILFYTSYKRLKKGYVKAITLNGNLEDLALFVRERDRINVLPQKILKLIFAFPQDDEFQTHLNKFGLGETLEMTWTKVLFIELSKFNIDSIVPKLSEVLVQNNYHSINAMLALVYNHELFRSEIIRKAIEVTVDQSTNLASLQILLENSSDKAFNKLVCQKQLDNNKTSDSDFRYLNNYSMCLMMIKHFDGLSNEDAESLLRLVSMKDEEILTKYLTNSDEANYLRLNALKYYLKIHPTSKEAIQLLRKFEKLELGKKETLIINEIIEKSY